MSFRAIDVSGLAPAVPQDQPYPILQYVEIDQLVIDTRYQRELGNRNRDAIQRIADNFDWMQFSPVLIAPTDHGGFAVIDGQHRVHAAKLCGLTRVPAQIVMASAAQQARAFAGVNSKVVPMTGHQVYRAALVAREPWAERCRDLVEDTGCTLATANPSAKDRKPRVIYQIGTVRKMVVERGQAEALRFVLIGIVGYDGGGGRVALYTDYVISPTVAAVHSTPALFRVDLVRFFSRHDPFKILEMTIKLQAAGQQVSHMSVMRAALQKFLQGQI